MKGSGGVVLVFLAFLQMSMALECSKNQHDLNGMRCCTKCPPGHGMVTPCNQENDTVCESCRKGELYSPDASHEDECIPCKTCPQYSHVKKMCNGSHDTVCECDHNYYWDSLSSSCRQCELCVMGFGAKRQCDLHRNTVCSQCPEGTYSDMISDEACKVCTSCNSNQLMVRYCDYMHDTICVDMHPPLTNPEHTLTTSSAVVMEESKQITQDKLIPVYCTILGLVILALVIYVIVKQVQYRRNPPNNKKNISYSAVSDPNGPTSGGPQGANATSIQGAQPTTKNQGSDSGVSLEHDSRPVTKNTRIKDLPASKLKAIEQMLHSSLHHRGGWTSFARELGYSNSKISLFESKSSQTGHMPAEILLAEWSKSENATVEVLVDTLKALNREDIITMLYSDNRHPMYQPGNTGNGNLPATQNPGTDSRMVPMYNLNSVNNVNNRVPPVNYNNMGNLGQAQGQQINVGQIHHVPGQQMNLGPIHGQQMNLGQIQGQMSPVQGQIASSISGSSTTDVSGRYGPHQHGLPPPSYHNIQGEQMV